MKDAQAQMRHSRAGTTLDIYQQFVPESQKRVVEKLGETHQTGQRVNLIGSNWKQNDKWSLAKLLKKWCRGTELNRRRQPFQGCALPPELPRHHAIILGLI